MEKRFVYSVILILVLLILVIGCVKKDIEHIPQAELEKLCAEESWPPEGCSVIADPQGKLLCEKCQGLSDYEEDIDISESELWELCQESFSQEVCDSMTDPEGIKMCLKCKELTPPARERVSPPARESAIIPDDLTQITFFEGEDIVADPDWSPDGSQIVFGRHPVEDEGGLYIINSDGTGLFKIGSPGSDDIYSPSWSPVDNKILCNGWREGEKSGLYMIDLDKDETKIVPFGIEYVMFQAWSPDGKKIVYMVYDDTNAPIPFYKPECEGTEVSASIWIMNSDGTEKTRLTTDKDGYCSDPSFSPDGSKIVYNKGYINPGVPFLLKEGANEIWVMNSDGSNKHIIYTTGDSKYFLHQQAWGKNDKIIFERIQWQKSPSIWVMNSDGTNPRVVASPADRWDAFLYGDIAWDNTGTKIVTTKWKSASEETPEIMVDRNLVTFTLEE